VCAAQGTGDGAMRFGNVLRWVRVLGQPSDGLVRSTADRPAGKAVTGVTAADVLAYLRDGRSLQEAQSAETLAQIGEVLAALPQYLSELQWRRELRGLERYVEQLPRIVTLYRQGYSCREIAAKLGAMCTDYGVSATLAALAGYVAGRLKDKAA